MSGGDKRDSFAGTSTVGAIGRVADLEDMQVESGTAGAQLEYPVPDPGHTRVAVGDHGAATGVLVCGGDMKDSFAEASSGGETVQSTSIQPSLALLLQTRGLLPCLPFQRALAITFTHLF